MAIRKKKNSPKQHIFKFTAGIKAKQDNVSLKTETIRSLKDGNYSNCCTI
jgi:hypothetical protein